MMRIALALMLSAAPAAAQQTPDEKAKALATFGKYLWDRGWNCEKATDYTVEEPDHFGDVYKVTCDTSSPHGARVFSFRLTAPKSKDPGLLKIEPWK